MELRSYFDQRKEIILSLGFRAEALPQLFQYIEHLWKSNEELNLISRKMTEAELIDNHVIDCLLPLKYFPQVAHVGDLGTGGGLPAVIYALQFPKTKFHLFEKSNLKQDFLKACKTITPNLIVEGDIPTEIRNIDLITARAFKPIDVLLDMSRSYYKNKGKYFLLKARKEKIDEEVSDALKKFKDLKIDLTPLNSPVLEVERHLVTIN